MRMSSRPMVRLLAVLMLPALACSFLTSPEILPPTATPPAEQPDPTPTPRGGGVEADGFFVLNLSASDQEGLELRADEIYQSIINSGSDVDRGVLLEAYAELANYTPVGGAWRSVGPDPIVGVYMPQGRIPGSGRVNGMAIDPRNSDIVFAAASVGGIWKTEDGGNTWRSLTDEQVPLIYGGIHMDSANPDILYARLGEFDGQVAATHGFTANGIMRSRDAGETWELIGADDFNAASVTGLVFGDDGAIFASSGQVNVLQAPPDQPEFGIFRSDDGGDTWRRLLTCSEWMRCTPNPASGATAYLGGFFDLDRGPDGVLYASLCNVQCLGNILLRSYDDGESWEEMDFSSVLADWESENEVFVQFVDQAQTIPYVEGLRIAVAQSDPNILLAGGGIRWYLENGREGFWSFVMRSTDGGDSWEWLPDAGDYCTGQGNSPQCDYDNVIEIDPNDANIMYLGGSLSVERETYNWIYMVGRSSDGGDTWLDMTPARPGSLVHADVHGLALDPNNPNVVWIGTDGGMYRTTAASANPPTWESRSDGMNTLLFIDVGLHPTDGQFMAGGLQDNAVAYTEDGRTWYGAGSGDGAYIAYDPFDPTIVYGSVYPPGIFQRNHDGGEGGWLEWIPDAFTPGYIEGLDASDNWLFYPPFTVDSQNEGVVYLVSNRVYRTDDRGDYWYPVSPYLNSSTWGSIQSIALAPSDSDVIYAGTTDGTAFASFDAGENWEEITGPEFPGRNLTSLAVDPDDPFIAYAIFGGFAEQTRQTPGHIFMTTDGGGSWEDISYNLPDAPLASGAVDIRPDYAGVYVGGALGVWVLQAGSSEWLPYGTGMPISLVTSVKINPQTGVMAVSTYGRSVWVMDMP